MPSIEKVTVPVGVPLGVGGDRGDEADRLAIDRGVGRGVDRGGGGRLVDDLVDGRRRHARGEVVVAAIGGGDGVVAPRERGVGERGDVLAIDDRERFGADRRLAVEERDAAGGRAGSLRGDGRREGHRVAEGRGVLEEVSVDEVR